VSRRPHDSFRRNVQFNQTASTDCGCCCGKLPGRIASAAMAGVVGDVPGSVEFLKRSALPTLSR
jgi:hypothetical protein